MIMWIAALVLVAATIAVGYKQGAIRAAFTFVGLLIAAALAIPFGPMFYWIFPLIGFKNPVVAQFGAPVIAFFAVSLVFKGIAAFVHRKVEYYYRYKRDDASRAVWEVLQARVGACVGALNGLIYFLVFALIVAVFGYTSIQIGGPEADSKVLSFLGKSAEDLKETEMDKVVAAFNPAPPRYFDTADTMGLLFHNRSLFDRLGRYPVFAAMGQQAPYQKLATDNELKSLIRTGGSFQEILANPVVREAVTNTDIVAKVLEVDVLDLKEFLETGVSPKFADEKLLGRWSFDLNESLKLNKRLKPDVGASSWWRIKNELAERFDESLFVAYHDNTAKFLLASNMVGRPSPLDPRIARLPNGRVVTNQVPRWFTTNALYSATGKWSGSAPDFVVQLNSRAGDVTAEAKLNDGKLSFQVAEKALTFTRLPD